MANLEGRSPMDRLEAVKDHFQSTIIERVSVKNAEMLLNSGDSDKFSIGLHQLRDLERLSRINDRETRSLTFLAEFAPNTAEGAVRLVGAKGASAKEAIPSLIQALEKAETRELQADLVRAMVAIDSDAFLSFLKGTHTVFIKFAIPIAGFCNSELISKWTQSDHPTVREEALNFQAINEGLVGFRDWIGIVGRAIEAVRVKVQTHPLTDMLILEPGVKGMWRLASLFSDTERPLQRVLREYFEDRESATRAG